MRVEKFIEIDAPVEQVFDLLSDFESYPRWMENVREVRHDGRRMSHWIADSPSGREIEWDVETTLFEPDRRIVWRSVNGDVETVGEIVLAGTRRGTTQIRFVLEYYPSGSPAGLEAARLFGRNAEQQLEEDLERFKQLIECPRRGATRGQLAGEVRDDMDFSQRSYGRELPEHGRQFMNDDYYAPVRYSARNERDVYGMRDEREMDERYRAERVRRGYEPDRAESRYFRDDERRFFDNAERERRFNEALREARESQIESMRRYQDEREREIRRINRRMSNDDWSRRDELKPRERIRLRYEDEERERGNRHLIPLRERERGREYDVRRPAKDYPGRLLRRGVDQLLDEPPSGRWREKIRERNR